LRRTEFERLFPVHGLGGAAMMDRSNGIHSD
jgi:hypothetical protein